MPLINNISVSDKGSRVLVSDFDGTMTQHDFFKLAIEFLIPQNTPNYWAEYRAGRITHFEALKKYFASIRCSEEEVLEVVSRMNLDPALAKSIALLQDHGWRVVVASAGCQWYIQRLLSEARIDVEIHANPGRFEEGHGLVMELPVDSPFLSQTIGIDKSRIVSSMCEDSEVVAFAGDGFPDVDPSLIVDDSFRFARGDLADVLTERNSKFHPFDCWSQIADKLLHS